MGPHQSLALVFALHYVYDPFNGIKRILFCKRVFFPRLKMLPFSEAVKDLAFATIGLKRTLEWVLHRLKCCPYSKMASCQRRYAALQK